MEFQPPNTSKRHAFPSIGDERDAPRVITTTGDSTQTPVAAVQPSLVVEVLSGPPGCRKSETMLREAALTAGRYLFAFPTIELVDEQAARFRSWAPDAAVKLIHSECGKGSVGGRLSELASASDDGCHTVAFVTHETLITNDLSGFQGWHVRIDESPNATASGYLKLAKSVGHFRAAFGLTPVEAGWSLVAPLGGRSSWRENASDTMVATIKDFHAWADRPADLLLKLTSFASPAIETAVPWIAVWTPRELTAFSSVTIAASGFLESVAYRMWSSLYGTRIEYRERCLGLARPAQPRIAVHYFTDGHEGSTSFWSDEGHECIVAVERWLGKNVPSLGYWSSNEGIRNQFRGRISGKAEMPRLAGLNRLRDETSCAIIYSSKPVPADKPIMDVFDITDEDVRRSREDEDIFQFVCRGAIRNLDFGGYYDAYVYSRSQAERLAVKLGDAGYNDVVCLAVEDAGIMTVTRTATSVGAQPFDTEAKLVRKRRLNARRSAKYRLKVKNETLAAKRQSPAAKTADQSGREASLPPIL